MSSFDTLSANLRDIAARKAEAQANQIRSNGQIWGSTLANIGEMVANVPKQQAELKRIQAQAAEQEAQAQERAQRAEKEKAAAARDAQLQGIFQKHGSDLDGAISEILTVDPVLGMDLQKRKAEADKMAFDYKTKQLEAKRHELEFLGNLVGSAKDQDSYTQALYTAKAAGMSIEGIPPDYNPQVVEGINRALLTAKERLELDKPKPPAPFTLTPGAKRFNPDGSVIAEVPPLASASQSGFTLAPGARRYDAEGKLIATAPERPEKSTPSADIAPDLRTTASGRKYVDLSLYNVSERPAIREAAAKAGAIAVSKEQADALQEIGNARLNQEAILTQIQGLLPKDATGRVMQAPGTALSRIFQTSTQRGAFNSWRTAAIQTLRATAGSKGLRINQAEIAQAIENDIPTLNDTVGVAKQKIANINTLLENGERSILVRDLQGASVAPPTSGNDPGWVDAGNGIRIRKK